MATLALAPGGHTGFPTPQDWKNAESVAQELAKYVPDDPIIKP